jgi:hypothetical protein
LMMMDVTVKRTPLHGIKTVLSVERAPCKWLATVVVGRVGPTRTFQAEFVVYPYIVNFSLVIVFFTDII